MDTQTVTRPALPNETTRQAQQDTVLSPRFYTTDFAAMERIDVSGVRAEWDQLIAELRADTNKGHFIRNEKFDVDLSTLPPDVYEAARLDRPGSAFAKEKKILPR